LVKASHISPFDVGFLADDGTAESILHFLILFAVLIFVAAARGPI
jgi:hypothetical protein